MNKAEYKKSKELAKQFLQKHSLVKNYDFYQQEFPPKPAFVTSRNEYVSKYIEFLEEPGYHFLLFDESFIKFEYGTHSDGSLLLRYTYFGTPFVPVVSEYLEQFTFGEDEAYVNTEQALADAEKKEEFVLIRYDYSEREYRPGAHSVSHFHIGYNNSIRVPCSFIVTPMLFVAFIIKQIYYDRWNVVLKDSAFITAYSRMKSGCRSLDSGFVDQLDRLELILN